jgi:hypothetical protein
VPSGHLASLTPASSVGGEAPDDDDDDEFSQAFSPFPPSSSSSSAGYSHDTMFPTHFVVAAGPAQPPASFGYGSARDSLPTNPTVRAATLHTLSLSVNQ